MHQMCPSVREGSPRSLHTSLHSIRLKHYWKKGSTELAKAAAAAAMGLGGRTRAFCAGASPRRRLTECTPSPRLGVLTSPLR